MECSLQALSTCSIQQRGMYCPLCSEQWVAMRCAVQYVVQPLSLPSSLYLVLYVDVSTLSQEDLSYLCMSTQSCHHQSCVAKLTREGGNKGLMKSTGDTCTWHNHHYSGGVATV